MLPPFGWTADPSGAQKLVVYEPEAVLVRAVFDLADKGGFSPDQIALIFNRAGVPNPGERMDADYPERYFIHMGWDKPEIEPIISVEQFKRVGQQLDSSRPRKRRRRR